MNRRRFLLLSLLSLAACHTPPPAPSLPPALSPPPAAAPMLPPVPPPVLKPRLGLALGGGAAKGYAHIGVIKALEAAGFAPDVVAGTSAGSVVGAMYAAGLTGFDLQEKSFVLDETQIRDLTFAGDGVVKGEKLQEYVNQIAANRPLEKLNKPFAAVATELDTGNRIVFRLGNVGQAVRASCSIPGVFQPTVIRGKRYVDGGVVSPVPVDAARELGADIVVAVDISAKAQGGQSGMVGIVNQAFIIMGQKLGAQELARADVVVRPRVGQIGAADFNQKQIAILEGEKAMQAALPKLREQVAQWLVAQHASQPLTATQPPRPTLQLHPTSQPAVAQ